MSTLIQTPSTPPQRTIYAVVVTYHPNFAALQLLLSALLPQVSGIVVVDNGSHFDVAHWLRSNIPSRQHVECIALAHNLGIAAAQNHGIEWCKSKGADAVMLFDQDSLPAPNMVACLFTELQQLESAGIAVGSLGPNYEDASKQVQSPFVKLRGKRLSRVTCAPHENAVAVDFLIASGSLIPVSTLNKVGGMREELFIDYVDVEWGLRAQQYGFRNFGVGNAYMSHSLGDEPLSILGRKIPLHSPLRHYYVFRNALWLMRQPYVPKGWVWMDLRRLVLMFGAFSLFAKPRLTHTLMMLRGIWDGMRGRLGRFSA